MKCLYTSDVHGNRWIYERLFAEAEARDVGAVLLGGDLTPLIPPIPVMIERQRACWLEFLRPRCARLRASGKRVLLIPGNDDLRANDDALRLGDAEGAWELMHGGTAELDGHWIVGSGDIALTPMILKDRERYDVTHGEVRQSDALHLDPDNQLFSEPRTDADLRRTLREELTDLFARVPSGAPTILMAHVPPYDTALDVLYDGRKIGSEAVRAAIETHRPVLGLHGHVHESPRMPGGSWRDAIGGTVVVNPGSSHHDGERARLHLVSFDTEDVPGSIAYAQLPARA